MATGFSRVARAALATGLISPLGCAADGPFELTDVGFSGDRALVLTFTKALAPAEEVDPDAFRLSLARSRLARTQYYDAGSFGLVEDCFEQCFYDYVSQQEFCDQSCPGTPGSIRVGGLVAGARSNQLELELSNPIGKPQCDWIDASNGAEWEAGFAVHYDATREPAVMASDGEPLASIMAHWVDADEFVEVDDRFPSAPATDPIPCPR